MGSVNKKKRRTTANKLLKFQKEVAGKSKPDRSNPFENIWARRKFDILGKKRKGEECRIGLARSRAIEKRRNTLLKEYEQSGKSSVFLDKRLGEQNEALGAFDKAILRFQRERQIKLGKKGKYNLSDGDEDGFSIAEKDDYNDKILPHSDDDGSAEEGKILEADSFEGKTNGWKLKKESMQEIIFKSKHFKALKAMDKEEDERLLKGLDQEFTSWLQTKEPMYLTQPGKLELSSGSLNKCATEDIDDYDLLYKEMIFEKRAHPTDRTKTPEEIAHEEKEKLEQLEEERQKRMLGVDAASDSESDGKVDTDKGKGLKSASGDDLGDAFSFHDKHSRESGLIAEIHENRGQNDDNRIGSSSEHSGSDEEDSDDECENDADGSSREGSDQNTNVAGKNLFMEDWEQNDENEYGAEQTKKSIVQNLKNDNEQKLQMQNAKSFLKNNDSSLKHTSPRHDYEAPKNLEELSVLLDGRPGSEVIETIRRIRIWNNIKLAAENRRKMQIFYGVLLQYFAVVANKKPLNLRLLNLLVKPLVEMSMETPFFAAICARQRLLHSRNQFSEDVRNQGKSSWPSLKTILLLQLWTIIFPCSDFRHVVMTPAVLLMSEYLLRCPVESHKDIAVGCFLCSMVLSVIKQSRKFCPEAVIFLQTALISALETKLEFLQHSQWQNVMDLKIMKPSLCLKKTLSDVCTLDFSMVMDTPTHSPFFSSDEFRASLLMSLVETLKGFVHIWEGFSSFSEIFFPFLILLQKLGVQQHMPGKLHDTITTIYELIKNKVDEHLILRRPLQMRKHKPVPIKLLNPKFEENFVKGRNYDPDRERVEMKKLKKRLKREAKGASRELRKDNAFLLTVKERDRLLQEEERAEKYGKARAFLQEQEHAFKSGQLGRGRKRRR